jgi:hypothetical protein
VLPRPNKSRSDLSLDIRESKMKQFNNDEEIPVGIGEQVDPPDPGDNNLGRNRS